MTQEEGGVAYATLPSPGEHLSPAIPGAAARTSTSPTYADVAMTQVGGLPSPGVINSALIPPCKKVEGAELTTSVRTSTLPREIKGAELATSVRPSTLPREIKGAELMTSVRDQAHFPVRSRVLSL